MKSSSHWFSRIMALLGVVFVAGTLLAPLVHSSYLTDDFHAVHLTGRRLDVDAGFSAGNIAALTKLYGIQIDERFQLYRPSVLASFGVDLLRRRGADPAATQATTLGLHLACGVMLFGLLATMLPSSRRSSVAAAAATLLFLISPVTLETAAWSAARSETLSMLFGFAALIVKWRQPYRMVVPILLFALAMTAKEAALVYAMALVAIDVFALRRTHETMTERRHELMRRTWPLLVVIIGYFLLRYGLFGSLSQTRYNNQSFGDLLRSGAVFGRWERSLLMTVAPVSAAFFEGGLRTGLMLITGVATTVALGFGLGRGPRRGRILTVAFLLMVPPFLLNCALNEVSTKLVNGRNLYLPFAAAMILVARALAPSKPDDKFQAADEAERGRWRSVVPWIAWAILVLFAVFVTRRGQSLYIDAAQTFRRTLATLYEPLRSSSAAIEAHDLRRVAIVGYRDRHYFDGSFTMSGAIRPALRRPFVARDLHLEKVVGGMVRREPGDVSLAEFLATDTSRCALFFMRRAPEGHDVCELLSPGRYPLGKEGIVLEAPAAGDVLEVTTHRPETLAVPILLRVHGVAGRTLGRVTARLLTPAGPLPAVDFAAMSTEIEASSGALRIETALPVPPAVAAQITERLPVGWWVEVESDAGELIGRSRVGGFFVEPGR